MRKLFAATLLCVLLVPTRGSAQEREMRAYNHRVSAGATVLVLEWVQTRRMIATYPCVETFGHADCSLLFTDSGLDRPVLDSRPSVGEVNSYFAASFAAHMAAAYLPEKWKRPSMQYGGGELELITLSPHSIKVRFRF